MRAAAPLALLALLVVACGSEPESAPTDSAAITYSVRGLVRATPTPSEPRILIFHEAIPEFADINGDVVGMDSMTMPLDLADGVDTSGLRGGDKVRFDLRVDWSQVVPGKVTAVEKLPPETELKLGG